MKPFLALLRKHVHDTRGTLILSCAAFFALGWLFVFVTSLNETEILKVLASDEQGGRFRWIRNMGLGPEEQPPPSVSIMVAFWSHPFIIAIIAMWAIARGSVAVAAEVERGTMDLILSRPVSRIAYLFSHVLTAVVGLYLLALTLALGAWAATHYNVLRVPPGFGILVLPAFNLATLGLPIYGYTLLASSVDQVRWRPLMIGSVLTLAGFIAWVISVIPVLQKYTWRAWLEKVTIFKLYNPVDAVAAAEHLGFDVAVLAGLGAGFIVLAFLGFVRRDLPANG
ncbi:MAG: ABC transporter permease subunit [Isosphaeraceae bacterium]